VPLTSIEYVIQVVSGTPEDNPVQVLAGGAYSVEDPGAASPYTRASGTTPATIKVSAACNGWAYDGATMNLSR
jgi:hypothetical protein